MYYNRNKAGASAVKFSVDITSMKFKSDGDGTIDNKDRASQKQIQKEILVMEDGDVLLKTGAVCNLEEGCLSCGS
jgi:hypothetical protein